MSYYRHLLNVLFINSLKNYYSSETIECVWMQLCMIVHLGILHNDFGSIFDLLKKWLSLLKIEHRGVTEDFHIYLKTATLRKL